MAIMCDIPFKWAFQHKSNMSDVCFFCKLTAGQCVQVNVYRHPEWGAPPLLIHQHNSGGRGGLMDRETISPLIYKHPCRSVLDQDAATGEQGSCSWLPLCVHPFAAMQTYSSLRKMYNKSSFQNSNAHIRAKLFSQSLIAFSWLVSPTMSGLRGLTSIIMEIMSDIIAPICGH